MAKRLIVFIISLMVVVFVAGCPPIESKPTEPAKIETLKLEPAESEPNTVEPDEVTPAPSEPNQVEPDQVESVEAEPNDVEPARVEPNNVELAQVEPNDLKIKPTVSFHDKCADVLKTFVDDKGMVDYKTLRRKRLNLKSLLDEFDKLDPNVYNSWPKEDKIAFWLNAYNIQMLKIITDNYPIKSPRYLRLYPGWGPNSILHIKGIWTNYKFLVMDE